MNLNFTTLISELIKNQSKYPRTNTKATFKALVDAIIPKTPDFDVELVSSQAFGALESHTDEYELWALNHFLSLNLIVGDFNIYLVNATAKMLNISAKQLIDTQENMEPVNLSIMTGEGAFASLAPSDRFRAITLLEQLKVDLFSLPLPFYNNQGFVLGITGGINMFATIGYYTEWSGYSAARMEAPEKSKNVKFPAGWEQSHYPGPSKGYHALRDYSVE